MAWVDVPSGCVAQKSCRWRARGTEARKSARHSHRASCTMLAVLFLQRDRLLYRCDFHTNAHLRSMASWLEAYKLQEGVVYQ